MNIFGKASDNVEIISREQLDNGMIQTVFKYGKLTIVGISNKPSCQAIERLSIGMNRLANKEIA
jgi:hypothetical protein